MKLATRGQEIQAPTDVFKDPVVMEFLSLPESHRLVETKLEEALIANLQQFLLELGNYREAILHGFKDSDDRLAG